MSQSWGEDPSQVVTRTVAVLAGLMCSLYYAHTLEFLWSPVCSVVALLALAWIGFVGRFVVSCVKTIIEEQRKRKNF